MTFHPSLWQYQREGAEFLASRDRALLADEMGLGKSAQAIAACDRIGARRILVICPAIVRVNWAREFEHFSTTGLEPYAILPDTSKKIDKEKQLEDARRANVIIASYDFLSRGRSQEYLLKMGPYDVIIFDEAHFLKEKTSKRTKAALGAKCDGSYSRCMAAQGKRVWFLTGTPMPNNPSELWPILRTCGVFPGTYQHFINEYCQYYHSDWGVKITGVKNSTQLRVLLAKVMLRRMKKDVAIQLPPVRFTKQVVDGQWIKGLVIGGVTLKDVEEAYQRVWHKYFDKEKDEFLKVPVEEDIAVIRRFVGMQKVLPVVDLVTDQLNGNAFKKLVLFCYHKDVMDAFHAYLADFGAMAIRGGMMAEDKQKVIDAFQIGQKCRVVICQMTAASTGVTLTAAQDLWIVEPSWVPAENLQAAMRVHRIGQKSAVDIRFVALSNSIDEKVMETLRRKVAMAAEIL